MTPPLVFVDTPVFLYTADERDMHKQALARQWVRQWPEPPAFPRRTASVSGAAARPRQCPSPG